MLSLESDRVNYTEKGLLTDLGAEPQMVMPACIAESDQVSRLQGLAERSRQASNQQSGRTPAISRIMQIRRSSPA